MNSMTADVALLTDRRYTATEAEPGKTYLANILRDDELLQAELRTRGLTSQRVDWSAPDVDWSRFQCAVFRTTWDYFDRYPEFTAWLSRIAPQTRLCNQEPLIRWNADKRYLADLESRGVPIVPSRFIERGSRTSLGDLLTATGWDEAVIKPCISGAARHTYRVNRRNAASLETTVSQLLTDENLILQPFLRDVLERGEITLAVFNGRVGHAVRKVPKAGDFRVQDDHGGTVHPHAPTSAEIEFAERAVAVCEPKPVYARVDVVRDERGQLVLMELELIEPELWLRHHPPSAAAFAKGVAALLT